MYALISVHICMLKKKKEGVGASWTQVSNVQITGHTVFELKYDFIRNKQPALMDLTELLLWQKRSSHDWPACQTVKLSILTDKDISCALSLCFTATEQFALA